DGTVLRDYGVLPGFVFPTFFEVDDAGAMAYFGESSTGQIRSLDLATGEIRDLVQLTFNYDFAFDVVPGLGYVVASAFGSATNSVFRVDLVTGDTVQVADLGGFSGPVEVDSVGNLYAAVLPDAFPFPAGGTDFVRFEAADVTSGAILTDEADGTVYSGGFNSLSSADYDPATNSFIVMETSTGTGSDSIVWKLDPAGNRESVIATAPGYIAGCQFVDVGTGSFFSAYQGPGTGVRISFRQCNQISDWRVWNVTPGRPIAGFAGPDAGMSGTAVVDVFGGPPNGLATLWVARAGQQLPGEGFFDLGGTYPVALNALPDSYARRLVPQPLDSSGRASFTYTQDSVLEGELLFQWLIFDANMNLVGSSAPVRN
ncbi:MAG: hypothetical protein AAFP86_15515, partial [Planctomycetota bacterium]